MDVVVGINLHQKPIPDVTVQPSDSKVRIVVYALDPRGVLEGGRDG